MVYKYISVYLGVFVFVLARAFLYNTGVKLYACNNVHKCRVNVYNGCHNESHNTQQIYFFTDIIDITDQIYTHLL